MQSHTLSTSAMFKKILFENNSETDLMLNKIRQWQKELNTEEARFERIKERKMDANAFFDCKEKIATLEMLLQSTHGIYKEEAHRLNQKPLPELQNEQKKILANRAHWWSGWSGMYYKMIGATAGTAALGMSLFVSCFNNTICSSENPVAKNVGLLLLFGVVVEGTIHNFKEKRGALLKDELEETHLDNLTDAIIKKTRFKQM